MPPRPPGAKRPPAPAPRPWSSSIPRRAAAAARRPTAGYPAWQPAARSREASCRWRCTSTTGTTSAGRIPMPSASFRCGRGSSRSCRRWRWSIRRKSCCRGGISAAGGPLLSTPRWRKSSLSPPRRTFLFSSGSLPGASSRSRPRRSSWMRRRRPMPRSTLPPMRTGSRAASLPGKTAGARGRTTTWSWNGRGRSPSRGPGSSSAGSWRCCREPRRAPPEWSDSCKTAAPRRCCRP